MFYWHTFTATTWRSRKESVTGCIASCCGVCSGSCRYRWESKSQFIIMLCVQYLIIFGHHMRTSL